MNQNLEDEINETLRKGSRYIHTTATGFFIARTFTLYAPLRCGLTGSISTSSSKSQTIILV